MKKLIVIASMLFLLPFSAFGLTMMEDSQMNDITAQAGVSIALDVNVGMHVDTVAWGDSDGIGGAGGWVGVSDMNADLFIGLRNDIVDGTGTLTYADAEVLTIDVDTIPGVYNDASFVRIGLGTLEIAGDMDMDFELGSTNALGQELGTLDINGMVIRLAQGGYVDVTTMGRPSGVTLNLNVLMDEINMDSLAWGDTDGMMHVFGVPTGSAAGYVGLQNLDIDMLSITGAVGIDVLTLDPAAILTLTAATHGQQVMAKLANVMDATTGQISDTQVVLSLGNVDGVTDALAGDINIGMGQMTATCVVGDASDFSGTTGVMGTLFIGGANVTVDGLVSIGAH